MGVDYDSKLVFGWVVRGKFVDELISFLIQNEVGTCGGSYVKDPETGKVSIKFVPDPYSRVREMEEYQCFCQDTCWVRSDEVIPKGVFITQTSAGEDADPTTAISLIEGDGSVTQERMLELLSDTELLSRAQEFAGRFGITDPPRIFSLCHIW